MGPNEFQWWAAYDQLWPIGPYGDEIRLAALRSTVANFSGNASRQLTIRDYMPDIPEETKPAWEHSKAFFQMAAVKGVT